MWVSRITAVALMMVLPGLGGWWLDRWLGVAFFSVLGFGLGLLVGLGYLVALSASERGNSRGPTDRTGSDSKPSGGNRESGSGDELGSNESGSGESGSGDASGSHGGAG